MITRSKKTAESPKKTKKTAQSQKNKKNIIDNTDTDNNQPSKFINIWNDFPPTEMQHDFGDPCGLKKNIINGNLSFINNELIKKSICSNQPLSARTDDEMVFKTFNIIDKSDLSNPGKSKIVDNKIEWERTNSNGIKQTWLISSVKLNPVTKSAKLKARKENKPKETEYFGEDLLNKLNIANNSVAIVDTEGGVLSDLKIDGKNGPSNKTLYYCINNITRADSADKKNPYDLAFKKDKNGIKAYAFSGCSGIIIKAIINYDEIVVHGNNELKMNYTITNMFNNDNEITQKWESNDLELANFTIDDAHKKNNIKKVSPPIKTIKSLNENTDNPEKVVKDSIKSFLQKRSGDQFQGWITKYLLKKIPNYPTVLYAVPGVNKWDLIEQDPVNLATLENNGSLGDIFTITIDNVYLCFCIECLGVSVLFCRPGNDYIFFKRVK